MDSLILILVLLFIIALSFTIFFSVLFPYTKGAPFVVSFPDRAAAILSLAKIKKGEKVVDLGSGDGILVRLFAQKGAQAYGFEIKPLLVLKSNKMLQNAGFKNARIYWRSFWLEDLSKYDVIVVYGIGYIMKDLEKKLLKEAKKGTRVISNYYQFPNLKAVRKEGVVALYIIP